MGDFFHLVSIVGPDYYYQRTGSQDKKTGSKTQGKLCFLVSSVGPGYYGPAITVTGENIVIRTTVNRVVKHRGNSVFCCQSLVLISITGEHE